jgi:hypothetical protein
MILSCTLNTDRRRKEAMQKGAEKGGGRTRKSIRNIERKKKSTVGHSSYLGSS